MKRLLLVWVVISGLSAPAPAVAQKTPVQQTLERVLNDFGLLMGNGPIYLASRVPGLASIGMHEPTMNLRTLGDFSVGLNLADVGLWTGFDQVATGMKFVQFDGKLPSVLPAPVIGLSARMALPHSLDVGLRVNFFPDFERQSNGLIIGAGMIDVGLSARYRLVESRGGVPEIWVALAGNYFSGRLLVGKDFEFPFDYSLDDGTRIAGSLQFSGAPVLGWDIWQMSPEIRVAWRFGWFQPFVGLATDLTFGHIDAGLDMRLTVKLTAPEQAEESAKEVVTLSTQKPALFTLRPMLGFQFAFTDRFHMLLEGHANMVFNPQPDPGLDPEIKAVMNNNASANDMLYNTTQGGSLAPVTFTVGMGFRYDVF